MTAVDLSPEEQAAADAAVAALRASQADLDDRRVRGVGWDDEPYDPHAVDELVELEPAPPVWENATQKRDRLAREQEEREVEDFGAFWAVQDRQGKRLANVVPGVDVQLPPSLPLAFEIEARRLAADKTIGAVHKVFARLYGEGTLAQLIAGGLDAEGLQVLIVWGSANAAGRDMTLAQAHVEYLRMSAQDGQGKAFAAPTSGPPLHGTGRSSRRTSHGSTGSKKKKSRR